MMSAFISSAVRKAAASAVITKHGPARRVETNTASITLMGAGSEEDSDSSSSENDENPFEDNPKRNKHAEHDRALTAQSDPNSTVSDDAGLYDDYDNISITTMVINGNIEDNTLPWLHDCDNNKNVFPEEKSDQHNQSSPAGREGQNNVNTEITKAKVTNSLGSLSTNNSTKDKHDGNMSKSKCETEQGETSCRTATGESGSPSRTEDNSQQLQSSPDSRGRTRVRSVTVASGEITWFESQDEPENPTLDEAKVMKMKPERFNPFDKETDEDGDGDASTAPASSVTGHSQPEAGEQASEPAPQVPSTSQTMQEEDLQTSKTVHRTSVTNSSTPVQRTSVSSIGTQSLSEWTVSSTSGWGIGSDEITNAELGMAEDHFSQPEGHFGQSTIEELEMGILNCKRLIFEAPPNSERQKCLVNKLVKLRLRLQEAKEGPEEEEPDTKCVVGHRFKKTDSSSTKHYCEKCTGVIWGVLQTWYRCVGCGFCCHAKCLNLITRTCACVKVEENAEYILSICPEKGLAGQSYRCAECRVPLSFNPEIRMKFAKESNDWLDSVLTSPEPRQCDYTGLYFCEKCHWNDTMPMPARVLHNWDLEPRKVCRASKQYLKLMYARPVLRINDINPMLFSFVDELNEVKKLREELLIMKRYFLSCKAALDSKLLLQLQNRQHFVDHSDMYSLKDLVDIAADTLLPELAKIHTSFAQHIKTDCQLCQAKGYVCELCDADEVLFPFDNHAMVCSQCSTVLHRHCFVKKNRECPKCRRINQRTTSRDSRGSH